MSDFPEQILKLMADQVPFNRLLGIQGESTVDLTVDFLEPSGLAAPLRAAAQLVRKGNRVCHVRVAVTQDGKLVAEGRGVYNIHKRPA
jgi:acyl-coenzyme A thioesterase PaaI-like protein